VQHVIDSASIQQHLVSYFPQTRKAGGAGKTIAAICYGVLGLSEVKGPDGQSVLFDASTTALPGAIQQGFFWTTRAVLRGHYKTYGARNESVEAAVSAHPLAAQRIIFLFGVEVFLADNLGSGR
jgi:ThiJ/PfpI family-like